MNWCRTDLCLLVAVGWTKQNAYCSVKFQRRHSVSEEFDQTNAVPSAFYFIYDEHWTGCWKSYSMNVSMTRKCGLVRQVMLLLGELGNMHWQLRSLFIIMVPEPNNGEERHLWYHHKCKWWTIRSWKPGRNKCGAVSGRRMCQRSSFQFSHLFIWTAETEILRKLPNSSPEAVLLMHEYSL